MKVKTDTERVAHSRKLVMEFLASSVDTELTGPDVHRWMGEYEADPDRFGARMAPLPAGERDERWAGHHHDPADPTVAESVAQPVKIDNELYVRDYSRCILCYKCVEACGVDAQNTFAIAVAGRGFDARISTEYAVPLNESACVYCGNCIGVCPTGALDVHERARQARGRHVGRVGAVGRRHDLPVLRRRMRAGAARAGQRDREGDLAVGQRRSRTAISASRAGSGSRSSRRARARIPPRRSGSETSLSQTTGSATGIVLAGGRSTRFGSDKLTAEYRGAPLLASRGVAARGGLATRSSWCSRLNGPEPTMPAGVSVRFARDTTDGEGPLAGLYAGLMASRTELVVVAGGDMPDLQPPVLAGDAPRGPGGGRRCGRAGGR